jgi:D-ribose pyranose/furanose isomerase RbsD
MANKRSLKHGINLICEELFIECVAASLYGNEKHPENTEALLESVMKMQADFISRVSHPEPGMKAKSYYKDLRTKFTAQVGELVDQINNL